MRFHPRIIAASHVEIYREVLETSRWVVQRGQLATAENRFRVRGKFRGARSSRVLVFASRENDLENVSKNEGTPI